MTQKKIEDYIMVVPELFTKEFCKTAIEELDKETWHQHYYRDAKTGKVVGNKDENGENFYQHIDPFSHTIGPETLTVLGCNTPKGIDVHKQIMDKLWHAIQEYQITKTDGNWDMWVGYTNVKYNRYSKDSSFDKHIDHTVGLNQGIPILSIIGQLNDEDDFDGGELIFCDDIEIKLNAGDVLMFPSNFMYPHQVKPIKKGKRYSYVTWVY